MDNFLGQIDIIDERWIMTKSRKKNDKAGSKKKDIIGTITPNQAFVILKDLAREDKNTRKRIEQIAIKYLENVDIEEIADDIFYNLDIIEVEELWDRSGTSRFGYVDSTEEAWVMFEEALEHHTDELRRYHDRSMTTQAKQYCMGILKGIYRFQNESESEYKDWAVDAPEEFFHRILNDWKKICEDPKDLENMDNFIEQECLEWVS